MNDRVSALLAVLHRAGLTGVLAERVLTAVVLGTLFVAGTLWLPLWVVGVMVAVAGFIAAFEWAALAGLGSPQARSLYAVTTLLFALVLVALGRAAADDLVALGYRLLTVILAGAGIWWLVAGIWIIAYERYERPAVRAAVPLAVAGWLAIVPALAAVWQLLTVAPAALLALFALVWSADIFAFFVGRAFGRRRLAPRVSPGKTWEGLLAALIGTTLLAVLVTRYRFPEQWPQLAFLAILTVIASVIGDLLESLLKRLRGVKDSGSLLPGHGGVLDRVDSILAAAPIFTFGLAVLGNL